MVTWEQVKTVAAAWGTTWRFTPPQSQWRDEACKNAVKALKKTLQYMVDEALLNSAEF